MQSTVAKLVALKLDDPDHQLIDNIFKYLSTKHVRAPDDIERFNDSIELSWYLPKRHLYINISDEWSPTQYIIVSKVYNIGSGKLVQHDEQYFHKDPSTYILACKKLIEYLQ